MEYKYTVDGLLGKNAEQIIEQIQISREGWDITLSRDGFSAHKTFREEQDAEKLRQEAREIVSQYLRALSFEIGVNIELAPSSSVQVRKPGHITLTMHEQVHMLDAVIVSGPGTLPAVEHLDELAHAYSTDPLFAEVVDLYVEACEAKDDPNIAVSLYKALEAIKSNFGGEKKMAQALKIPDLKNLKRNLNWHRHWPKKDRPPKKLLSMADCKQQMRQVILSFLEHQSG